MRFYIPTSDKHVLFDYSESMMIWNIWDNNHNVFSLTLQDGTSPLAPHELISIGQILEIQKQVQAKTREYDPYCLFSKLQKEKLNGKV